MHAHLRTRLRTQKHRHTQVHSRAFSHTHIYICMHAHMHAHTHACTHTCMHVHMHACTHTCKHAHMRTHTHAHTRTHTHTHTNTHTHTHAPHTHKGKRTDRAKYGYCPPISRFDCTIIIHTQFTDELQPTCTLASAYNLLVSHVLRFRTPTTQATTNRRDSRLSRHNNHRSQ